MTDLFDYENKNVTVECTDGNVYEGFVDWCIRAADSDENEDMLGIGSRLFLASEIKTIEITDDPIKRRNIDREALKPSTRYVV
ncbi:MAG: hypothetical protein NC084_02170 [Bacteroides sp.]|nr:hypothetical protein [Eubacterium sp.]MCM1419552.1 hypothetical protein [Roseburia sp.]MCM1461501.1 hypothetical protein [Bacteroides sp.]